MLALDPAASEFYEKGKYVLTGEKKTLSSDQMIAYWAALVADYPIVSIEDGLAEGDRDGLDRGDEASSARRSCSSATTSS